MKTYARMALLLIAAAAVGTLAREALRLHRITRSADHHARRVRIETAVLATRLDQARARCLASEAKLVASSNRLAALMAELDLEKNTHDPLRRQIEKTSAQDIRLAAQLDRRNTELRAAQEQLLKSREESDNLKREYDGLKSENIALKSENQTLTKTAADLQTEMNTSKDAAARDRESLTRERESLRRECDGLKARLQQQTDTVHALQERIQALPKNSPPPTSEPATPPSPGTVNAP